MKKSVKKTDVDDLHIVKTSSNIPIVQSKQTSGDKKFDEAIDKLFGKKPALATK